MRYIKSFNNDAAIQAAVDDKSLGKPYVALDKATGTIDWNSKENYVGKYLTIEATSPGNIVITKGKNNIASAFYSLNNDDWVEVRSNSIATVQVQNGDKLLIKGTVNMSGAYVYSSETYFSGSTASFKIYGNIMSLFYDDDFEGKKEFPTDREIACGSLFQNCTGLTDVSKLILPALVLGGFSGNGSYSNMFRGCTSLTTAPALPATTLGWGSYRNMFYGCTSLNYVRCLATDISTSQALTNWLADVSSTGTFVKKAGVNWPSGTSGIPSNWTVIEE